MREACRITAQILHEVHDIVLPGKSTEDLNTFIHRRTLELGGKPATLGYKGFPKSCCTSLNEIICHGIPNPYVYLKRGDILNIDVTTIFEGYHGDASCMFFVGGKEACSSEAIALVEDTKEALTQGIRAVAPGKKVGDIGVAIQSFIRKIGEDHGRKYGIVREYTGHGVGKAFHEPPSVLHFGKSSSGPTLLPGMTFTIEPMINLGTHRSVVSAHDGWTVRTADGKLSAQWEHTVLVTLTGVEILTLL
jgi:methionyl aminopeptidase